TNLGSLTVPFRSYNEAGDAAEIAFAAALSALNLTGTGYEGGQFFTQRIDNQEVVTFISGPRSNTITEFVGGISYRYASGTEIDAVINANAPNITLISRDFGTAYVPAQDPDPAVVAMLANA